MINLIKEYITQVKSYDEEFSGEYPLVFSLQNDCRILRELYKDMRIYAEKYKVHFNLENYPLGIMITTSDKDYDYSYSSMIAKRDCESNKKMYYYLNMLNRDVNAVLKRKDIHRTWI